MPKRASWFKVHLAQRGVIKSISSEAVGDALKAALDNFADGEEPQNLSPLACIVYNVFLESIAEARADYAAAVEGGRKSAQMRATMKDKPHEPPPDPP